MSCIHDAKNKKYSQKKMSCETHNYINILGWEVPASGVSAGSGKALMSN